MDERWEDVYACITPYTVDFEDEQIEFVKIGMYVWYDGGFYWSEQNVCVDFNLMTWLLNEMVKKVDEYLDEGLEKPFFEKLHEVQDLVDEANKKE